MGFKGDFNERKAAQVAARILRASGGTYDYLKLVKLLYLVERTSLVERSRPVIDDEYFSLPFGPVVSRVMDLTTRNAFGNTGFWASHIAKDPSSYEVSLVGDPGDDELSQSEEALIDRIWEEFGRMTTSALLKHVHALPEWKDPGSGRIRITLESILEREKTPEQVAAIKGDLESIRAAGAFFSGL